MRARETRATIDEFAPTKVDAYGLPAMDDPIWLLGFEAVEEHLRRLESGEVSDAR